MFSLLLEYLHHYTVATTCFNAWCVLTCADWHNWIITGDCNCEINDNRCSRNQKGTYRQLPQFNIVTTSLYTKLKRGESWPYLPFAYKANKEGLSRASVCSLRAPVRSLLASLTRWVTWWLRSDSEEWQFAWCDDHRPISACWERVDRRLHTLQ